jgi:hypothetical protein
MRLARGIWKRASEDPESIARPRTDRPSLESYGSHPQEPRFELLDFSGNTASQIEKASIKASLHWFRPEVEGSVSAARCQLATSPALPESTAGTEVLDRIVLSWEVEEHFRQYGILGGGDFLRVPGLTGLSDHVTQEAYSRNYLRLNQLGAVALQVCFWLRTWFELLTNREPAAREPLCHPDAKGPVYSLILKGLGARLEQVSKELRIPLPELLSDLQSPVGGGPAAADLEVLLANWRVALAGVVVRLTAPVPQAAEGSKTFVEAAPPVNHLIAPLGVPESVARLYLALVDALTVALEIRQATSGDLANFRNNVAGLKEKVERANQAVIPYEARFRAAASESQASPTLSTLERLGVVLEVASQIADGQTPFWAAFTRLRRLPRIDTPLVLVALRNEVSRIGEVQRPDRGSPRAENQTPAKDKPSLAPPTACPVRLREMHEAPLVCGREVKPLSRIEYKVVKVLVNRWHPIHGLTELQLENASGCNYAARVLRKLRVESPDWGAVIVMSGPSQRGYRLAEPRRDLE